MDILYWSRFCMRVIGRCDKDACFRPHFNLIAIQQKISVRELNGNFFISSVPPCSRSDGTELLCMENLHFVLNKACICDANVKLSSATSFLFMKIWDSHHMNIKLWKRCESSFLFWMQKSNFPFQFYIISFTSSVVKWAAHDKTNKISFAPSEAQADQSSLSAWRNTGSWATNWAHCEDRSDWADAQISLSLCWVYRSFRGDLNFYKSLARLNCALPIKLKCISREKKKKKRTKNC